MTTRAGEFDAKQAAIYCDCAARTIKDYARRYRRDPDDPLGLQGIRGPRGWRFKRESLDDWLRRYTFARRR